MNANRTEKLDKIRQIGETVSVEFKRCGGNIEHDVYETVCAFSNRFGGDIYLGILDDGTVNGVLEKSAPSMIKNFITVLANPNLFSPTLTLDPEFSEGDVFRITVPLDDAFSWDAQDISLSNESTVTEQVTEQVKKLVECLKACPLSTKEILQKIGLKHRPTLMNDYIKPALALGLIEMTQPDSPKSPTQKYKVKNDEQ
ncbi:MAG: AlbA family DNA-binding domain-containing protein [Treponema sp.]